MTDAAPLPEDLASFRRHPLVRWVEYELGIEPEADGRLKRRVPRPLSEVAQQLAVTTASDPERCASRLRQVLVRGSSLITPDGTRTLPFKLHQVRGKKKSSLKQRFHSWMKAAIVNRVSEPAQEVGISVKTVDARGTSSFAYDGSGEVKRDSKNYALAVFTSGKQYNRDLNAAYNIAARSIAYKLKLAYRNSSEFCSSKHSGQKRRIAVTLSRFWSKAGDVDRKTTTTALVA